MRYILPYSIVILELYFHYSSSRRVVKLVSLLARSMQVIGMDMSLTTDWFECESVDTSGSL